MSRLLLPVSLVGALALVGCSGAEESTPTATASAQAVELPSPSLTPTPTPTPSQAPSADGSSDLLDQLRAALPADLAAEVTSAELESGSFARVATTLVDPRGDDGSPAAQQAIAICEAAAALEGVTDVNVAEADGTSWILFGHPMVPEGACGEV